MNAQLQIPDLRRANPLSDLLAMPIVKQIEDPVCVWPQFQWTHRSVSAEGRQLTLETIVHL